jgi:hypothetical protein
MSEAIWKAGMDPAAMLGSIGTISARKQRLVNAALVRRCKRFCESSQVRAILERFESDEALACLPELRQQLDQESAAFELRRQASVNSAAPSPNDGAASEGQGVTYPAEVPNAAAALLDEEIAFALGSAGLTCLELLRGSLDLASSATVAQQVQEALISEGRATVLMAVAGT